VEQAEESTPRRGPLAMASCLRRIDAVPRLLFCDVIVDRQRVESGRYCRRERMPRVVEASMANVVTMNA
jgi:hypothetical protein